MKQPLSVEDMEKPMKRFDAQKAQLLQADCDDLQKIEQFLNAAENIKIESADCDSDNNLHIRCMAQEDKVEVILMTASAHNMVFVSGKDTFWIDRDGIEKGGFSVHYWHEVPLNEGRACTLAVIWSIIYNMYGSNAGASFACRNNLSTNATRWLIAI
ncbi:hypothetical protein CUZ56_02381 [Saezia sanguinis]|uniref:Uncharacterized protein n=1 Tax=Saezia sanguinis TaxID=1965230 RepID=A0A433SBB4_9BURK|nr:hypothetical protein [Saezia sanguinis]RUS66023.1 hypothetical protein CUZ56_02381 [Saezia sanguinis]